jgi:diguanylate cyclase (GGDEF)-like protein
MRNLEGRASVAEFARANDTEIDWHAEFFAAAALDDGEQRLRGLIEDVSSGLATNPAAAARVRVLTRLVHALSRATVTDSLTGLRNRQGFLREGSLLLSRAAERDRHAIVLFVDVDRLKEVNDAAGHAAGDEVLCCAARALVTTLRSGDVIGRLSGDEFAAVALARRDDAVPRVLERLAHTLACINEKRAKWPLEFSVGTAVATPGAKQTLAQLLNKADRAMYQEKRARSVARHQAVEPQMRRVRPRAASNGSGVLCTAD